MRPILRWLLTQTRRAAVTYLLRDDFTTAASAPLTSPRTCDPGPGTLTVVDAGNLISTSGGGLVMAGTFATNQGVIEPSGRNMETGLLYATKIAYTAGRPAFGVRTTGTPNYFNGGISLHWLGATRIDLRLDSGSSISTVSATANGVACMVVQSDRLLVIQDTTLLYPTDWTASAATRYGQITPQDGLATNISTDYLVVTRLPVPWSTDYGIATARTASASAGATLTAEANAIVEATWTAATGEVYELDVRRTDADNRWIVRCDQAGSTIKLIERNAGVETERASAAQTWTNATAYRIVIICNGATINTFVANVAKNSYASATFNATATGVKTSHAVANLIAWPRTLSGVALSTLQAVLP